MRKIITLLILMSSWSLMAQNRYTDRIQQSAPGEGKLVIFQSEAISKLVNSVKHTASPSTSAKKDQVTQEPDSAEQEKTFPASGRKVQMNGFRIQVYSGNNSRKGKMEATMMGQRVKSMFSELNIYTHFTSPHWICRVGDFKTYEEANEYFRQLKASGRFDEAVIVRSKVTVFY